ncbi:P-loop containing nucleoside triphosphate hydrolase protein [Morchella conica CCBAS932]|uniref:Structural maintenance of chromosomes protein 5 n=1 Tax=Morchella conica CCBAS932 TaxID=1392247 RepID=A0A3N4KW09_9PEZI|nr:P-loop containing nucleoside triphosphate hydrolase protein [Morchella conica CCBAS932]
MPIATSKRSAYEFLSDEDDKDDISIASSIDDEEENDDDEEDEEEDLEMDEDGTVKVELGSILPPADPEVEDEEEVLGREGLELGPNEQPFQPGSIVRIKVNNFVTYSQVEVFPGPNLNMVIGPNGTGKSTIVCAVCLGLGWGPGHLGRAKDISEFVKHGAQEARIEIELQGQRGSRNPIIVRRIIREGNASSFTLDGKPISNGKLLKFTRSYSIQIDNLCQFLPQDRVVEFAGLNPIDLMRETQRAAAPPKVLENHENLKKLGKRLKEISNDFESDRATLKSMEDRQAALQQDVERLRERQEVMQKIELLEKARPFIAYTAARKKSNEAKEAFRKSQGELEELKNQVQPMTDAPKIKKRYRDLLDGCVRERKTLVEKKEEEMTRFKDRVLAKYDDEKKKIGDKREAERDAEKGRREAVSKLKARIEKVKKSLENEPPEINLHEFNQRLAEKRRDIRQCWTQAEEKKSEIMPKIDQANRIKTQITRAQTELEDLETATGQRERLLRNMSPDTFRAWHYYKSHKDEFEAEIFGPPVLTCSIKDPKYADVVETLIGINDKKSFVCQTRADYLKFVNACFGKGMGLADVTIRDYSTSRAPTLAHQPGGPIKAEELARYGFDGYALDYMEGPEPVLNMLCNEAGIHRTPISLKDFTPAQNKQMEETNIVQWIAGRTSYRIIRRREYNASSIRLGDIRPATVFKTQQVDQSLKIEIERKISELEEELASVEEEKIAKEREHREIKAMHETLKKEAKDIEGEKTSRQQEVAKFNKMKATLGPLEEDLKLKSVGSEEYKERIRELSNKLVELAVKKAKDALQYGRIIKELVDLHQDLMEAQLRLAEAQSDVDILEKRIEETKTRLENKKQEVSEQAKSMKAKCKRLFHEFTEAEKQIITGFPETKSGEDIDHDIEIETARLSLLHEGNPNAIKQYEDRQAKITALTEKIAKTERKLQELQDAIQELREAWEPKIDILVAKISTAFTKSFEKIGCAGEVKVHKEEDFDKWAVHILVKFRANERLQILNNQRQSGGERAVSTVFYLMALQSLARSPFRVVDEINQGMDPRNERLVHHRMVNIACQEYTSQYFLITPKLLPDLMYHPRMKIHCINSGDWIDAGSVLDNTKYLKIGQALKARGALF